MIQKVIEDCDYYLLVIGGKYGSVDPDTDLSFTEKEYDFAVSLGKPVLAFLHGEPEKIEFGKSEQQEALQAKLEAFRERVKASKHVKYWTSPEDLAGKVARSFTSFRRSYPAVGWVRGDAVTSTESLSEINSLRKELEATQRELSAARTEPPPGAGGLSQGEDKLQVPLFVEARIQSSDADVFDIGRSVQEEVVAKITWDEMFSAIGPSLLDEGEENVLLNSLHGLFDAREAQNALDALKKVADGEKITSPRVRVPTDTFGTILIQFKALGLIEKSERKRSVSDVGTYWTLTPYGEEHLTSLRAIRRGSGTTAVATDEDGESAPESTEPGAAPVDASADD